MLTTMIPDLKKTGSDEWTGPCPFCGGVNRFVVNMNNGGEGGLYWCRKQDCGAKGDAITYLREKGGLSYKQACVELNVEHKVTDRVERGSHFNRVNRKQQTPRRFKVATAPDQVWIDKAASFAEWSQSLLGASDGEEYMSTRGIDLDTLEGCRIGWNPQEWRCDGDEWGEEGKLYIAQGVVIPWYVDGQVVRVNVRRISGDGKRYQHIKGGRGGMFIAGDFVPMRDTVVCEGEIDAMSLKQLGLDMNCVATGSAQGSRDEKSIIRLASSGRLFVALDPDKAGDDGWNYWHRTFRRAKRLRPIGGDINQMLIEGTLTEWVNEQTK